MKDLSIIVAMTNERVIGLNGKLPWNIPEESKLFQQTTKDSVVVMGRNTYYSIGEHPLEDRINIVVSSKMKSHQQIHPGLIIVWDFDRALKKCEEFDKRIFFIGGARIYEAALPIVDNLYISWIKNNYDGDAYFPEINFDEWLLTKEQDFNDFITKEYRRKKCL